MTNKINDSKLSKNEEDYLKAIFHLTIDSNEDKVGANKLAEYLNLSPASVNSMVKKLKAKKMVNYERYGKMELSEVGQLAALSLIRKHRLWETFLYEHLNFTWDEVHEVAEQLEHIRSEKLMKELDAFLGFPAIDPHGDVIPNADGSYLTSVKDGSVQFLQYLSELGLTLSTNFEVLDRQDFDKSMSILVGGKKVNVSKKFSENIFVL